MGGRRGRDGNAVESLSTALVAAVLLAGCEGASLPSLPKFQDLNPFDEKEVPLPGKRISVIQQENVTSDLAPADKPITLPPPRQNDSWSQPGGVASNAWNTSGRRAKTSRSRCPARISGTSRRRTSRS